jgi:hypothetical protein
VTPLKLGEQEMNLRRLSLIPRLSTGEPFFQFGSNPRVFCLPPLSIEVCLKTLRFDLIKIKTKDAS